ncbi:MAG TPA: transglutaminaseTgpA domain-containing protein [Candidatus Sumerlaeota bacterium]|nr:transglutaminaseTgpA domain-containing protein [Candidatus Sumerlaeota bacterium]
MSFRLATPLPFGTRAEAAAPTDAPAPGSPFHLFWRRVTFFLVLLGFLALLSTGELTFYAGGLFLVVWLVGYIHPGRPRWWTEWMSHMLIWASLGAIAFLAIQARFDSLLYLLIFLGLYKCLTLREPLDHLHAMLMSFFMLLACSIISTSVAFVLFLLLFMVLITLDLVCLSIGRGGAGGRLGGAPVDLRPALRVPGHFFQRMVLNSTLLGLTILLVAFALFLTMPHFLPRNLNSPWSRNDPTQGGSSSGYRDEVTFTPIDRIQLDDTQVITVAARWADRANTAPLPTTLRLRGEALDYFDERQWRRDAENAVYQSDTWGAVAMSGLNNRPAPILEQRIYQDLTMNRLFGAGAPVWFDFSALQDHGWRVDLTLNRSGQSLMMNNHPMFRRRAAPRFNDNHMPYYVYSKIEEDHLALLRRLAGSSPGSASAQVRRPLQVYQDGRPTVLEQIEATELGLDPNLTLPTNERFRCTRLPDTPLIDKIRELSFNHATSGSRAGKVLQLVEWLRNDFEYSLDLENTPRVHPLETFLTRSHKGHCEYFASSLALLLRAQAIPARVVSGFYTADFQDRADGRRFIVRQSDAHAWTEVWLDGVGWLTIDPTPPLDRGRAAQRLLQVSRWERLYERARLLWQTYVLDYSSSQTGPLARMFSGGWITRLRNLVRPVGDDLASKFELRSRQGADSDRLAGRLVRLIVPPAFLAALVLFLVLQGRLRRRQSTGAGQRSPVLFINQLIRRLQALGWTRQPSQTLAEWFHEIDRTTRGQYELAWILDLYHRCRFGDERLGPRDEQRAQELIRAIRRPG